MTNLSVLMFVQWNTFWEATLTRGHPPLKWPLDNVNTNTNVLISTPDERPPLLKGHFSDAKGVASQEGFHCTMKSLVMILLWSLLVISFVYCHNFWFHGMIWRRLWSSMDKFPGYFGDGSMRPINNLFFSIWPLYSFILIILIFFL